MNTCIGEELAGRKRSKWIGLSFESVAIHSERYRADVDGLRAVAVLAVVFFHLGFARFSGGFVGVDIFYVISGYLITSLLVRDIERGGFSIVSFYERRIRRIFPALFTVLFVSIAAASLLLDPDAMASFGKALVTTSLFASNLYFWHSARPSGYFDEAVGTQPLLHTWSLSVEEQFYVLFPITLFLLVRWLGKRAALGILFLAGLSLALNLWATQQKPIFAFYWFVPRAWELMVGSLLAMRLLPRSAPRLIRELVGLLGLCMIVFSILCLPIEGTRFPGYLALLPCLGTGLVIYSGATGPSVTRTVLSFRPLVFVGVISYSLYLWHWPLLAFSKHLPVSLGHGDADALVLVGSTALAFVSFEYIERPFRGNSHFSRRQIFTAAAVATMITIVFGMAAYRSRGLPNRYEPTARLAVAENLKRVDDFDGACSNWKTVVRSLADINFCTLGDPSRHKIMFWGDSHVEQLYPAIQHAYSQEPSPSRASLIAIEDGCLPDPQLNNSKDGYHCDTFAKFALLRAKQADIEAVFIGFSTWWASDDYEFCTSINEKCETSLSARELQQRVVADLSDEIRDLRASGKQVIVCLPFPMYSERVPQILVYNALISRFGLSVKLEEVDPVPLREAIREAAAKGGAEIFDPRQSLCLGGNCLTQVNGVSIYKDSNHLARSGVGLLDASLRALIRERDDRP